MPKPLPPAVAAWTTVEAEVGGGDRDQDRAAEDDLDELVDAASGGRVEGDVVALAQVGGVAVDRAHADREREEHLARGGQPGAGVHQARGLRLPHEVEADERALDHPGVARPEAEAVDRQHRAEQQQQRHADLRRQLDALHQAAREDVRVEREGRQEPAQRLAREGAQRAAVGPQVVWRRSPSGRCP
jgi:hypothetical protein